MNSGKWNTFFKNNLWHRSRVVYWDWLTTQSSNPNDKDGRHTCFHNIDCWVCFFAICTAIENHSGFSLVFSMALSISNWKEPEQFYTTPKFLYLSFPSTTFSPRVQDLLYFWTKCWGPVSPKVTTPLLVSLYS